MVPAYIKAQGGSDLCQEPLKCTINPLMVTRNCTLWGLSGEAAGIHVLHMFRCCTLLFFPFSPWLIVFGHEYFLWPPSLQEGLCFRTIVLFMSMKRQTLLFIPSHNTKNCTQKHVGDQHLHWTGRDASRPAQIPALASEFSTLFPWFLSWEVRCHENSCHEMCVLVLRESR